MNLEGKVAFITGSAQGIGQAYAERLASLGALVIVADIDGDLANATAASIVASGHLAEFVRCDITDPDGVSVVAADISARHGGIDILVNNAGLYRGLVKAEVDQIDVDYWRKQIEVNLNGTFYVTHAVVPFMRGRGWGRIVNQGSLGSYLARPGSLHYAVSKAGVMSMVKVLARELGREGITVNAMAPGPTTSAATLERMDAAHMEDYIAQTSVGRLCSPEDMADVLEFLCSDHASMITGQTLIVDGGMYFLG